MNAAPRLLVVLGPTGTGKTALASRVAPAIDGEVVGCDALQLYRGFDVATAKPTPDERLHVPHHLVDVLAAGAQCTLADYVALAERAIADVSGRGRVPLVVGGSGMYLRGLLRGVVEAPPVDPALRQRLARLFTRFGPERLHRWLGSLDPASAERLEPRDAQRIGRALELALSGETWSERLRRDGTWEARTERFGSLKIGLDTDRAALARRVTERVDRFFDAGLVAEVAGLLEAGVPREAGGFKAIGYRETLAAWPAGDSPALREQVKRNTRGYVKRQRAWFRKEPGVVWLDAARGVDELAAEVIARWRASASNQAQSDEPRQDGA